MKALLPAVLAALSVAQVATAASPYRYSNVLPGVGRATVSINSAAVSGRQQVSVWVGAVDSDNSWIQTGVTVGDDLGRCAYVEVHDGPSRRNDLRCVKPVALGQPVRLRLSFSARHGWVAWVDGVPEAHTALGSGIDVHASAERYLGGDMTFTLTR